jgi:TonB-dependent starch-binding outer membrane protein SusC
MAEVRRLLLALVVGLLCTVPLSAQTPTGTVTGRVVDSTTQQPLSDVSVVVEGTRRGAVTGPDGTFTIGGVPAGTHTVRARRIGFSSPSQVVTVADGASVTVNLSLDRRAIALEDVVTVGYGTQRREAITGSVATIDASQANVGIQANVNQMIEGRAPGVNVIQNSGEPGAGAQILIRGGTSITASNEPLYVIDGIPINNDNTEANGFTADRTPPLPRSPLNLLNPSDIASISILKDAAATAIYGSRAANGVILIETKKGPAGGGNQIEYEVQAGSASPAKHLTELTGDQYRSFIKAEVDSGNLAASALTPLGTANTDWEDVITRSAPTVNHNLSFAGGSADTRYRASLNYMNQQGVVLNNGFQRLQGRLNGSQNAFDGKLRLQANLTGSQVNDDYVLFDNTGGFAGGIFINALIFDPTKPITVVDPVSQQTVYYEIGPGSQAVRNPVAMANQIADNGKTLRALGNFSADYDIFSALTARVNVGADRASGNRATYLPIANPMGAQFSGWARQINHDNTSRTLQTQLTFHPQFSGTETFDLLGGYEFNDYTQTEFGAQSQGFLTDAFGFNNLGSGTTRTDSSWRQDSRLVSFFTRANASLRDKYFITGVLRRDGSSRFGVGNKWALFPAISGSWRISQEGFMKTGPFSDLRLRAGWGKQGNQAIAPYASLQTLCTGNKYPFGDAPATGVSACTNANPNLKWEETASSNLALDYGLLSNRLLGSVEYYVKNTRDLLLTVNVPQPAVVSNRLENVGKIRNSGLEFSLDGEILSRPGLNWSAGVVYSHDKNTVLNLGPYSFLATGDVSGQGQSNQTSQRIIPGQPLGTFYGPVFAGVDAQGHQLFNKYTVTRDAAGHETSRVLAGTTTSPGGDDKVILGNANPTHTLGVHSQTNWNKFDFSFLVNSAVGQKVFNNTALVYATKSNALQDKNFLASALTDQIGIKEPAIFSSRYIENGSFVRLANVTVGYSFNMPGFMGTNMKTARVSLSGDNLWLSTPYTGYDPEVYTDASLNGLASRGTDYLHYPKPRTITGGLRVTF